MGLMPLKTVDWGNDPLGIGQAAGIFFQEYNRGKAMKFQEKEANTQRIMQTILAIANDPNSNIDARANALEAMVHTAGGGKPNPVIDHLVNEVIPQMREEGKRLVNTKTGDEAPATWSGMKQAGATIPTPGEEAPPSDVRRKGEVPFNVLEDLRARKNLQAKADIDTSQQNIQNQFVAGENEKNRISQRLGDKDSYSYNSATKKYSIITGVGEDGKPKTMEIEGIPQSVIEKQTNNVAMYRTASAIAKAKYEKGGGDWSTLDPTVQDKLTGTEVLELAQQKVTQADYYASRTVESGQRTTGDVPMTSAQTADDENRKQQQLTVARTSLRTANSAIDSTVERLVSARNKVETYTTQKSRMEADARDKGYDDPATFLSHDKDYLETVDKLTVAQSELDLAVAAYPNAQKAAQAVADDLKATYGDQLDVEYEDVDDPLHQPTHKTGDGGVVLSTAKPTKVKRIKGFTLKDKDIPQSSSEQTPGSSSSPLLLSIEELRKKKLDNVDERSIIYQSGIDKVIARAKKEGRMLTPEQVIQDYETRNNVKIKFIIRGR